MIKSGPQVIVRFGFQLLRGDELGVCLQLLIVGFDILQNLFDAALGLHFAREGEKCAAYQRAYDDDSFHTFFICFYIHSSYI